MKKILLSIGSILFAGAILAGGTGAFLNDAETSTGNTFASGVVDLKVDNESYVTDNFGQLIFSSSTSWALSSLAGKLFFNFLDVKPGDIGEDTISLHVNNNNAWACMNIALTGTPENGRNDPELAVDPTGGVSDGELQNNLYFTFWADDGDNVFEVGEKTFKTGLAKDIFNGQNWVLADASKNVWGGTGPLLGGTTVYIGKAWCFGTMAQSPKTQDGLGKTGGNGPLARGTGFACAGQDVGNIVQSDGIKADVSFLVAQSRNNASYLCSGQVQGTSTEQVSTSTLFSENFNTTGCQKGKDFNKIDNAKWDTTGKVMGEDWGGVQGKLAFIQKSGSLTSVAFSTVGYHNITLKYDRNLDIPPGAPATLTVDYSSNNGSTWTTLETVTVDSDTTQKTWSLSPGADNKAAVKFRFTFVGTNTNDHAYIDNVTVTGVSM